MQIRPATAADHAEFVRIVGAAGLSDRPDLLGFYLNHPDMLTYVAEEEGRLIGTGAAANYGGRTGWLGVIAVLPERQGLGTGTALVRWGEQALRARGVQSVILLASAAGRPLYERLGFRAGSPCLACAGTGAAVAPAGLRPLGPGDWEAVAALDYGATGERRERFLRALPGGYVVSGPGGAVTGFCLPAPWGGGPAVAADPEAGCLLIDQLRWARGPGPVRMLVPEVNEPALRHLTAARFQEVRRCTYMVKGAWPEPYRPGQVWGMFSFALG